MKRVTVCVSCAHITPVALPLDFSCGPEAIKGMFVRAQMRIYWRGRGCARECETPCFASFVHALVALYFYTISFLFVRSLFFALPKLVSLRVVASLSLSLSLPVFRPVCFLFSSAFSFSFRLFILFRVFSSPFFSPIIPGVSRRDVQISSGSWF